MWYFVMLVKSEVKRRRNMAEPTGKWKLRMGLHRKTIDSRDTVDEEYDSLEDCKQAVDTAEKGWAGIGYFVWYAIAYGPKGEQIKLHEGTPYA
jgi:hypothetical protein